MGIAECGMNIRGADVFVGGTGIVPSRALAFPQTIALF
jgi:hypothetical protein